MGAKGGLNVLKKIKVFINCVFRNKHSMKYFNGYGYRCENCFKTKREIEHTEQVKAKKLRRELRGKYRL